MSKKIVLLLMAAILMSCFSGCSKSAETSSESSTALETTMEESSEQQVTQEEIDARPGSESTALIVKDTEYSVGMLNIYYAQLFIDFAEEYGDYATYYGLDISGGVKSLKDQTCTYSEDGTWYGFFMSMALEQIPTIQALCDYAAASGIALSDTEMEELDEQIALLNDIMAEEGYSTVNDLLIDYYGEGVTVELYRQYIEENSLARKAYSVFYNSMEFTDEELAEYYATMEDYEEGTNQYRVTNMRHILILAEADENGDYTEEAIANAHETAEAIYEEWLKSDQTEDSFAEFANTYSEDPGSNTVGGLYSDIYQGYMVSPIDTWLFNEEREAGDVAIVDNAGSSYTGTHVLYFTGYGDIYANILARDALEEETLSNFLKDVCDGYTAEKGKSFEKAGTSY